MTDTLTCVRCSGPTTLGTMTYTKLRDAGPTGGRGEVDPAFVYCSSRCFADHVTEVVRAAECSVCKKRQPRPIGGPGQHGPGTPDWFCSPKCEKARRKFLVKAARQLVKDPTPKNSEDAREQIAAAQALRSHWKQDAPKLIDPPSPRALGALAKRLDRLHRVLSNYVAEDAAKAASEQRVREKQQAEKRRQREAELDQQWRDELAKAADRWGS